MGLLSSKPACSNDKCNEEAGCCCTRTRLFEMSVRVAGGGKKPTKFEIEYLARYGIDSAKAKQIKELVDNGIIEQTDNGLYLANTEAWPSQYNALRDEFRSSMSSGIMNTILMGTPADKPLIVDGIAYVPIQNRQSIWHERKQKV